MIVRIKSEEQLISEGWVRIKDYLNHEKSVYTINKGWRHELGKILKATILTDTGPKGTISTKSGIYEPMVYEKIETKLARILYEE